MSHAQKCPVCEGKGKLPDDGTSTAVSESTCHGCGGTGWVTVHSEANAAREEEADEQEEAEAREELKRITPPNAELLKLADHFPAPQEWFEDEVL